MLRNRRHIPPRKQGPRTNEKIRVPEIRVIDENGEQLGVMSPREALKIAEERELDLVEIAPQAKPPVCKIVDFGKYRYEQQKREKAQRKSQQQGQLKEVRLHPRTDTHDVQFKVRHAKDFLGEGHKVKFTVVFKGREITRKEVGRELLQEIIDLLVDDAKIDQPMRTDGHNMSVILSPEKKSKSKKSEGGEKTKEA